MGETIDLSRVHIFDLVHSASMKPSLLVRGNAPLECSGSVSTEKCTFAYDTLMQYVRLRAANASIPLPTNNSRVYLIDVTFEGILDKYFLNEAEYWDDPANAVKGRYMQWELFGAPIWATELPNETVQEMLNNPNKDIWAVDQLPERVGRMRQSILRSGPPQGYDAQIVYVHCAGGCDRTGEFVGAYRMAFYPQSTLKPIYDMDVAECGRSPNYFASGALGWYCLQWNKYNATPPRLPQMPDCLTAYTCELFGKCDPTNV